MKKFISILLALVMALSLVSVSAFAAENYTIKIEGNEDTPIVGHTYKVYQIFTGDLANGVLSNIKYGANFDTYDTYTSDTTQSAPKALLDSITDAEAFAKAVALKGEPIATLNNGNGFSANVVPGYYLIVDDTGATIPQGDTYSKYMVKVVEDVTMFPKSTTVKIEKNLSDDDHGLKCTNTDADHVHRKDCYNWSKSNEVSIGETVHFQLKSAVPVEAVGYQYYYFIMGDTASEGLTIKENTIAVYANGQKLEASAYTLTGPSAVADTTTGAYDGGSTFEIALKTAKDYAGQTIEVYYDAILNADAVIGTSGNPNEAVLKYSNKPYDDHGDNGDDGYPDSDAGSVLGVTPADTTITYATGIKFMKVDQDLNPLQGAQFTVTGTAYKTTMTYVESFVADENGAYWELNNGQYTTVAPTEDSYVAKDASDRNGGYVKDGDNYRVATKEEMADASVTLYKLVAGTKDQYASTTEKYALTGAWTPVTTSNEVSIVLTTDENGYAALAGLGDGEYHVTESVVPAGYNKIEDFDITIEWGAPTDEPITTASQCAWTVTADNVDGNLTMNAAGVFELQVINQQGATLPTTGGMGTTLFYVIGGILVAAAAVVFITRKRVGAED